MQNRPMPWWALRSLVVVAVLALASLPFLYAVRAAGPDFVFGGFLLNPQDGNTYLAKMVEGWNGAWRFTLPYTYEPGRGAYLFLFYLFLGHLSRWLHLPLLLVYHAARLASGLILLLVLDRFFQATLPQPGQRFLAFALAALGSGLGWLALPSGAVTSDFWVAEAYPFLSIFATPHFALGLALLLWILLQGTAGQPAAWKIWRLALASLALSLLSPFGVVIALVVLGGLLAIDLLSPARALRASSLNLAERTSTAWRRLLSMGGPWLAVLLGGAPFLIYDLWVTHVDPQLAAWNAQNLTPSPPGWDLLLSFSPLLLLSLPGARQAWRSDARGQRLLLAWAVLGLLMLYLPFGLQRRFMMGLWVPVVGLGILGLSWLAGRWRIGVRPLAAVLLVLALPTNLLVLLAGLHGVQTHDAQLYLTRGEARALQWISQQAPPGALVLASPSMGLFIPAYTGRRVLYGHPFETVEAAAMQQQVLDLFRGGFSPSKNRLAPASAQMPGPRLVFFGPRERALGGSPPQAGWQIVYSNAGVTLYAGQP